MGLKYYPGDRVTTDGYYFELSHGHFVKKVFIDTEYFPLTEKEGNYYVKTG